MLGAVDRQHAVRLIAALAAFDGAALLAEADALRVTVRCSYGDMFNAAFPRELYTPARFPGLVR